MSDKLLGICADCGHQASCHRGDRCMWSGCRCTTMVAYLNRRECEIVRLWAKGLSHKEVAIALGVATKTAEAHAANIRKKFRLSTCAQVVLALVKAGQIAISELPDLPVKIKLREIDELQSSDTPVQRPLLTEPHCTGNTNRRPV